MSPGAVGGPGAQNPAAVVAPGLASGPASAGGSSVDCPGLGTITVDLPSGTTNPALPDGVLVSVGYRATNARTRAPVTGGSAPGDIACGSVPFTNLTASQISQGPAPAGVNAGDRLTGTWNVSVTVGSSADGSGPRAAAAAPALASSPLTASIQSYLANRGGSASVAVFDATTGVTSTVAPGNTYVTASIVKVDILATRLRQRQDAGLSLSSGDQSLATQMIEVSDNNAATALWNEDGGGGGVAGFNRLIPMPSTSPGSGGLWGLTRTTAQDQVALVRNVAYPNSVLGSSQRAYEQGLMQHVTSSQRWGVSGGVPSGVGIALKNGWLPVSGGWEINSIGHIFGHGKDYVIAVLTSGNPSMGYGISTIQGVSSIVWSQLSTSTGGSSGSGPSVAVASNGNKYVFYRGGDGNLWQAIWDGSAWTGPYDLGMGPLGSEPSADIDASGGTAAFWKGGDGNLWEGYWTGTAWSGARRVAIGPLKDRPSATVTATGTQYVFWKGPDNNLFEAIGGTGQAWGGPYDLGMGPLGSEPSADVDAAGRTAAFWQGGDGNLWEGYWTGSAWSGAHFIGMGPLAGRPTAAVSPSGTQYVFWKGGDANAWQAIGTNGGSWGGAYNLGMGPLGSDPSAGIDGQGKTTLVWRGGDGNLWQGYWTGSAWSGADGVGIPVK